MNACAAVDARLEEYLAGRLSVSDAESLEAHAAGCERCATKLEQATRLPASLPTELAPPVAVRERVLTAVATRRRRGLGVQRWFIPAAIAAGLMVVFALANPGTKSGQGRGPSPSGQLAALRADAQFKQLEVARSELTRALADAPDDAHLKSALSRLDAQRRALESLVKEFDS